MNKKYYFIGLFLCGIVFMLLISSSSATSGVYWTKSYYLSQGLGVMHEIQVDSGADLVLTSPAGANYDLYAMRNHGPYGSCPSNEEIMANADQISLTDGIDYVYLDSGLWCLVVYAQSGSGTYLLEAGSSLIPMDGEPEPGYDGEPDPWSEPLPEPYDICTPYRKIENSDTLTKFKSEVGRIGWYILTKDHYSVTVSGSRTMVEWILLGPCEATIPNRMLTSDEIEDLTTQNCGPKLTLTVNNGCDPEIKTCLHPDYSSGHSNSYYRVENPEAGSTYYVTVSADNYPYDVGYTLLCRSYTCTDELRV